RGTIIGITSAATIFVVASIGMAVGSGLPVTAIFTTLLLLGSLVIIGNLEQRLGLQNRILSFRVMAPPGTEIVQRVHQMLEDAGLQTRRWHTHPNQDGTLIEFEAEMTVPQERDLVARLEA